MKNKKTKIGYVPEKSLKGGTTWCVPYALATVMGVDYEEMYGFCAETLHNAFGRKRVIKGLTKHEAVLIGKELGLDINYVSTIWGRFTLGRIKEYIERVKVDKEIINSRVENGEYEVVKNEKTGAVGFKTFSEHDNGWSSTSTRFISPKIDLWKMPEERFNARFFLVEVTDHEMVYDAELDLVIDNCSLEWTKPKEHRWKRTIMKAVAPVIDDTGVAL